MSLFSSFLCCSSDIPSDNNNSNNTKDLNNNTQANSNNNHTNHNQNKAIKTDNKDYSKDITINNNKMISLNNKNSKKSQLPIDNTNSNNKKKHISSPSSAMFEKSTAHKNKDVLANGNNKPTTKPKDTNTGSNNDVMRVDSNDADEEKEYDDSEDMEIDSEEENKYNKSPSKEKQTVNVYTNETDRSTGSSDYGYNQQQLVNNNNNNQSVEEPPQLTAVSSHEENNDSVNNIPSNQINADDSNNLVNNIQEININGQAVTSSDINTTTVPSSQNPISNIDPNNYQNMTAPDNMDYNMIQQFDENEEFIDLTVLQPDQYHAPGFNTLLSPKDQVFKNKKLLVLDLDETLVHSSFKYLRSADFVLPVDIDDQIHNVYVIKRPGVDEFLQRVGEIYEVVVFTASVNRYGDPLLDILDKTNSIHHRLFREACYNYEGNYIKNLSQLGRPLSDIIILDNSPASYIFHPQHAIPISSWFSDTHDNELLDIIPLLEDLAMKSIPDVGKVLDVSI